MDAKIDNLIADKKLKEAESELFEVKKETEKTIQRLNESKEALSRAEISKAFSIATYFSEAARKTYWERENERIGYKYNEATLQDRIDQVYYINCQTIALTAKYNKDVEVGDAQINQLVAAAKELNALADKHNWDKETYRKQVLEMIERWENQTFNERLNIGLEFGENIVELLTKLRRKKSRTVTNSSKNKNQTHTETYQEYY